MAFYHLNPSETSITISSFETVDSITYYDIKISCYRNVEWTVKHRFKDFYEIHEKLQKSIAIPKDLLPGKKLVKNLQLFQQRKTELEKYLQAIAQIAQLNFPLEFVEFLDFQKYDVIFLLQRLAKDIFKLGYIQKSWTFTILEMHAISSRVLLPRQSFEVQNSAFDFSNILDFCCHLEKLQIVPERSIFSTKEEMLKNLISPIGTSNILSSTLTFDMSPFTSIQSLELIGIVPQNIVKCNNIRSTVENLKLNNTRVQTVKEILLPDSIHKNFLSENDQVWYRLKNLDLAYNEIWLIDPAIKLAPNIEELHLNDNKLKTISNLRSLCHLNHLNLSGNMIESLLDWHLKLGNISVLNLSCNQIQSLKGVSHLKSLRILDLSRNQIKDINEIENIAKLPVIEYISLNGNIIAQEMDYRIKILSMFVDYNYNIILDNETSSQTEIDKAMVLAALRNRQNIK
ncbi:CLUMA_CG020988, isoform A [Clunio marinus]|uniref:CLUMA_CG020988, isoform A n=1 Tax=Clunio marinus TaxID=568069 RepID=A0A1J1J6W4_9DIPT|nr:CLUMA_CG020988, isoform A [Clunio marinus]